MHFQTEEDIIFGYIEQITNAVRSLVNESNKIFIVISGDIAFAGKREEYELALDFLTKLENSIKAIKEGLEINYVTIPGNHDCDFDQHTETRQLIINDIAKNEENLKRLSIIEDCFKPQQEYFNWAALLQSIEFDRVEDKLFTKCVFPLNDETRVEFLCFNTSWMNTPEEEHGNILFPTQIVLNADIDNGISLVLSLVHHPYKWIKLESANAFQSIVESRSNIILTGHEHESSYYEIKYLEGETRQYVQGGILQNDEISSFNTLYIDLDDRKMIFSKFTFDNKEKIYSAQPSEWIDIPRSRTLLQDKFVLNKSFNEFTQRPGVPFSHPRKSELVLEDFFIFPDLEELSDKLENELIPSERVSEYILSSKKILIFGPEQSGKTSLLKVMFRQYYRNNMVPIWIDGELIVSSDLQRVKRLIADSYVEAYGVEYAGTYKNLDPSNKVLIINKLHKSSLNRQGKIKLFDYINNEFDNILISSEDIMGLQEIIETDTCEFLIECKRVSLSEFGLLTKNKLIEKWVLLGQEDSISETHLDYLVKQIESTTRTILTPNLVPSFPFFILTIAQATEDAGAKIAVPFTKDEGSFGFFYEWLITSSLHNSPKQISDLSAKYRYLSDLAFQFFQSDSLSIDEEGLKKYHDGYLKYYSVRSVDLPYRQMIRDLLDASVIKQEHGSFSFYYPCIFYYFVSRALNTRLQNPETADEAKKIIAQRVDHINEEESEFILLFLSYLSENPYVRDIIIDIARQTYKEHGPSDLDTDIDFINKREYRIELDLTEEKPREIREQVFRKKDEETRKKKQKATDETHFEETVDEYVLSIRKAIKIARVMGQIAKNFATSLPGPEKYKLTEESCLLGLRVMKHIFKVREETVKEFITEIKGNLKYRNEKDMLDVPPERRTFLTDKQLENAAEAIAFVLIFIVSANGVNAISRFIGTARLYPIYDELFEKYGYLMSVRLIDFAIRLDCQEHLPLDALSRLEKDLRTNYVGMAVLKRLVFNRLRLYEADQSEKQAACKLVGIKVNHPLLYMGRKRIGRKSRK